MSPTPAELGYRMPAEWEPHAATWLSWPHEPSAFPGKLPAVGWVFCEVARHLTASERVRMIVEDCHVQVERIVAALQGRATTFASNAERRPPS